MALTEEIAGDTAAAPVAIREEAAAVAAAVDSVVEGKPLGKFGGDRPISSILIVVAMQTEAVPLIPKFDLVQDVDGSMFPKCVPWVRYHGTYRGLFINLVIPGKDLVLGVDGVGTVSVSLLTYASIQAFKPDLIINAGTAGGFSDAAYFSNNDYYQHFHEDPPNYQGLRFLCYTNITLDLKARGACIKDVYIVTEVAFHDRRIPIPVFDLYGIGARKTFPVPNLLKELGLKAGKLSTGDSLDMSPHDEASITANGAVIKDMEGAAVAYVADMFSVPAIFVKAVTDIVDGEKPTAEEFLHNLLEVTAALHLAVAEVVNFISGKNLSVL